jgi:hypothetical protein
VDSQFTPKTLTFVLGCLGQVLSPFADKIADDEIKAYLLHPLRVSIAWSPAGDSPWTAKVGYPLTPSGNFRSKPCRLSSAPSSETASWTSSKTDTATVPNLRTGPLRPNSLCLLGAPHLPSKMGRLHQAAFCRSTGGPGVFMSLHSPGRDHQQPIRSVESGRRHRQLPL